MKTKNINLTYAALLAAIVFALSFSMTFAQTLNRPLLGPDSHSGTNTKPEQFDGKPENRPGFVGKLQDARKNAKDAQTELRDRLKNQLRGAEDNDARREILDQVKTDRRSMLDDLKNRRHEIRSDAKTEAGKRIKSSLRNILNRLDNSIQKFANILGRIDEHIQKLNERGADTTSAEAAAAVAQTLVETAGSNVDAVHSLFEEALESDNPRDYIDEIRAESRDASESIKEAHRAVNAAIQELKGASRIFKSENSSDDEDDDSQDDVDNDDDNDTQ